MNFKQLRAFREVMLTGSVSKAASNLHRTQPAISAQITSLEAEIGIKLFSRRNGRLYPVPEAEYLLTEATQILEQMNSVQQNLVRTRDLESGKISIVSMTGPTMFLLPHLISGFVKDRKDVSVSLISHSSFRTQQLLAAQRYDVGIMDMSPDMGVAPSLVDHDVLDYECLCAVPENDPLAQKSSISAEDLDGKPLVVLVDTHLVTKQLETVFEEQGLAMNRRFETQYFIPQLTFVEQELAYAIVDPLNVESYRLYRKENTSIVFLPFEPKITFSISLVTPSHRPLSYLANAFITHLKEELLKLQ